MEREEFDKLIEDKVYQDKFEIEWCIGGLEGGSCWSEGDQIYSAVTGEAEPEFSDLDSTLLEVAPNMSFLMYKKLMSMVTATTQSDGDFYGNSRNYAVKSITVDKVWDFLQEYDLV